MDSDGSAEWLVRGVAWATTTFRSLPVATRGQHQHARGQSRPQSTKSPPVRAEKTEFEMHRHPDPNVHAPPDRPWTADGFPCAIGHLSDGGRGPRITLNQPCGVSTARQPRLTMLVNLPRSHEQRSQPKLILGTNHKQKLTCKSLSQNGLLEPKWLLPAFPFSLNLETL